MASLASYLLSELQSGTGDIAILTYDEDHQVKTTWHTCVLSRAEYFKGALTHDFQEKQSKEFIFRDVATNHMKAMLSSLYLDELPEADAAIFQPKDFVALTLLGRRLIVPSHILISVQVAFGKSCQATQQSCDKWVALLLWCVEKDLPQQFVDSAGEALKRNAKTDEHLTADACLEYMKQCRDHSKLDGICADLLGVFASKVHWGENLLGSLAVAYSKDLDKAADSCLSKLGNGLSGDSLDKELKTIPLQEGFSMNHMLALNPMLRALVNIQRDLEDEFHVGLPDLTPKEVALCHLHPGRKNKVYIEEEIDIFTEVLLDRFRQMLALKDAIIQVLVVSSKHDSSASPSISEGWHHAKRLRQS